VWKRGKGLPYFGSLHGGDLPEMYGFIGDHVGTDAFGMCAFTSLILPAHEDYTVNFINHRNPNYPSGSTATSPLSNINWPKYTLDDKKMLLFSDDSSEEYTTIPDTYRADGIAAIVEVQTALGV